MPENDAKERILKGETIEAREQVEIGQVRANILSIVRTKKGLPQIPTQLEVDVVSQLSNAPIIENEFLQDGETTVVDLNKYTDKHSIVGLVALRKRISDKKAAQSS